MINVSKEFIETMEERTDFTENAEITFSDGTVLPLSSSEFTINNNSVTDGAGENSFPLGVAIARCIQIEIMNDADQYSNYDFLGAKIRLFLEFELSETVERVEFGTFTVITPETYGTTVIISAVDDMYKADKEYTTGLLFPSTLGEVVRDSCTTTGITLGTTSFFNDDFIIAEKPAGLTHRELYGYAAMISCGNARINRLGSLEIKSYDFADSFVHLDGGDFINYDLPDRYDGGTFEDYSADNQVDGGAFLDREKMHILSKWKNLFVDTDDLVITGVQTVYREDNEEIKILEGSEGYVLQIDNPFIAGKEGEILKLIAPRLIGGTFRKFEGDLFSNPLIEFMDDVYVIDRKGNCYRSIVTDANFVFYGYTTVKCSVESALRSSSRYYSTAAKAYQESVKLTEKEKTEREKAIEILNKTLSEASGLYETEVSQADGSKIYYLHDKKTLAESENVIKLTSNAVGLSTDGGKTFPAGFTIDGVMIAKILHTEGINADWINTGTLSANRVRGGILQLGSALNNNGVLELYDSLNVLASRMDNTGLNVYKGKISGPSIEVGGTENKYGTLKIYNKYNQPSIEMNNGYISLYDGYNASVNFYNGIDTTSREMYINSNGIYAGANFGLVKNPLDYSNKGGGINNVGSYLSFSLGNTNVPIQETYGYLLQNNMDIYNGAGIRIAAPNIFSGQTRFIGYNWNDTIVTVEGAFISAGIKSRAASTKNYSTRLAYCYEMATPIFGDIGMGVLDENGECYVEIDDIFSEMIKTDIGYHVFLQKYGKGDIWIEERDFNYFKVKGTPHLKFSWEIKALQNGFENLRLEDIELETDEENSDMFIVNAYNDHEMAENSLENLYYTEIENYEKEMEDLYYE